MAAGGGHVFIRTSQFKIFKKELHLTSPFAKTGDLFWTDFPKFHFFVDQGGCEPEGLV